MASSIFTDFRDAHVQGNGPLLATVFQPTGTTYDQERLRSFLRYTNHASCPADIKYELQSHRSSGVRLSKAELSVWTDILVAYWKAVGEILNVREESEKPTWARVFTSWKELCNAIIRGYTANNLEVWTIPCLYVVGKYLRIFAIKADEDAAGHDNANFKDGFQDDIVAAEDSNGCLEETARIINRMFTLCLNDRSPIEESRKWGIYNTTNLLFKTYFKLNAIALSKNVLRALDASQADLPPLDSFPKSHVVTFKYYLGVISFLDDNYAQAEAHLTEAWQLCHKNSKRNLELILTYLVPCHLLTKHTLPTSQLLKPFPRLEALFRPLARCIKNGDLAGFDAAMAAGEEEFVKRRIYLTLEKGRDIALRNLFRKVFIAGGFDSSKEGEAPIRRTRVPVTEFATAVRVASQLDARSIVDKDEVECYLSNLIYKNLMKGYIARDRGIVVLSKGGSAFPGTGL